MMIINLYFKERCPLALGKAKKLDSKAYESLDGTILTISTTEETLRKSHFSKNYLEVELLKEFGAYDLDIN